MNERIKELTHVLPYEWVEQSPANIEKFVELIIQECIDVTKGLGGVMTNSEFADGTKFGIRIAFNVIKQHFGIEE